MKTRPILFNTEMVKAILEGRKTQTRRVIKPQPDKDDCWYLGRSQYQYTAKEFAVSPYAKHKVGDRLWVRETWATNKGTPKRLFFKADEGNPITELDKWRPSIHMPRWASRITLEITDIRAERLQEITAEGTYNEGLPKGINDNRFEWFQNLWNSIYKKQYRWEDNPWVWIITFKIVIEKK